MSLQKVSSFTSIRKSLIIIIVFSIIIFNFQPNNQVYAASVDDGFLPDAKDTVHVITIAEDGKIWVGGEFLNIGVESRLRLARLNPDGSADTSFSTGTDGIVRAIAVQPDGGVLVGGSFSTVTNPNAPRNNLFRINPNGTLDTTFDPSPNGNVYTIGLQSNGDIIVGGDFTTIDGANQAHIARLNPDGNLDPSFSPSIFHPGGALSTYIYRLAVQIDDRIVISGSFTQVNNEPRLRMTRLDKDGELDPTFASNVNINQFIDDLVIQPDGKILFSGQFDFVNSFYRPQIARLNADGTFDSDFSSNAPWLEARIYAVALQSDGKILFGGTFTDLYGTPRNRIARLQPDGQLDLSYDPDIGGGDVLALAVESNGGHLVGGRFTTVNNQPQAYLARLYPSGLLDKSIDPLVMNPEPLTNELLVLSTASQPDGSTLIGGFFSAVNGEPRSGLARLKPNLSLDTDFAPEISGTPLSFISAIAVQPDGKILIGGIFDKVNGITRTNLARLNQDGNLDMDFSPDPDNAVRAILLQPDGKIWVGGDFSTINGSASERLVRLYDDGVGDMLFSPGADAEVLTLAQQSDGSLIVGGSFTQLQGQTRRGIGRLILPDGDLDASFNPGTNLINNTQVQSLVIQPDGKILVGGNFEELAGVPRDQIARLHANGAIDDTFNPGADRTVYTMALQADGSIIVGGIFEELGGEPRKSLGKLKQDGNLNSDFDADVVGSVYALALQFDGKLLVGGQFSEILKKTDIAFARIAVDEAAQQSLSILNANTALEWSLSGSMPVLSAVNFSFSMDGSTFSDLGTGTRTSNGWELTGLNLETGKPLWIRANGIYNTGNGGSSVSVIESTWNVFLFQAPTITSGAGTFAYVGSEMNLFTFTATGIPTPQITLSGNLPSGLEFTPFLNGTANLSGTPDEGTSGVHSLVVTASNGVQPDANQNFTLTVYQRPEITSANNATAVVETVFEFIITTKPGYPLAAIDLAGPLPAGIVFVDNGDGTATISGTAEEGTEGVYPLIITASSFCCSDAVMNFTLRITSSGSTIYLPLILRP